MRKSLTYIVLLFLLVSCDIYTNAELINHSGEIISNNKHNLKIVSQKSDFINSRDCLIHKITITRTSNLAWHDVCEIKKNEKLKIKETRDVSEDYKKFLWRNLPKEKIVTFYFVKGVCHFFKLTNYRNNDLKHAKIIFIQDSKKFNYLYNFQEVNNLQDEKLLNQNNWIYYFDKNWAITTGSINHRKTSDECFLN